MQYVNGDVIRSLSKQQWVLAYGTNLSNPNVIHEFNPQSPELGTLQAIYDMLPCLFTIPLL